jgi:hypothetical protein
VNEGERPLRTHWHPERQFQNIQGSLREELNASDAVSGSFGVIREIAVLKGPGAMNRGSAGPGTMNRGR